MSRTDHPAGRTRAPADLLVELLGALLADRPVPGPARAWFLDGSLRAIRRGETLDVGLGLAGKGTRSLQSVLLRRVRDQHLCAALDAIALDPGVAPWPRCVRLAQLIRTFKDGAWPRAKRLAAPPVDWPAAQRELWHALRTDFELPQDAASLYQILTCCQGGVTAKCGEWTLLSRSF